MSEQAVRHRKRGPNTPEGKRRVSTNALKHGLTATSPQAFDQMARESGIDYDALLDKVRSTYWPIDQIEDLLCKRIARCMWRLARMERMEDRILERNPERTMPGPSYEAVLKAERTVSLELHRCFRTLNRKRELDNKKSPENNLHSRSA